MLEIKNLTFSYPRKRIPVIDGISLTIRQGGIYGLLGRNGIGKSTLLYLIAGLLTPKKGEVELFGINTRKRLPKTLADIYIVPETFQLPKVPLKEYVQMVGNLYPRFSEQDVRRYLDIFDMPFDINLGQLSMGQAKKIYMSVALAANTPLLLMDEPTNGLDIPSKAAFRGFIASAMTDERTVVISTHQVQDINLLLDHVLIMENDGILLNSPVSTILDKLAFTCTNDQDLITNALYSLPSLQGTNIISHNDNGTETQLNLETLFDFVTKNPSKAREIFTEPTPPHYEPTI